jgi:hypothetical protein
MTVPVSPWDDAWRQFLSSRSALWPSVQPPTAVPENLVQPVLPGWNLGTVINLTEHNSAAPQTELAILQKQSYGRQLGQIADALQVLLTEREAAGKESQPALERFSRMKEEIDDIKNSALADRIERLRDDLATLRTDDRKKYGKLRARLLDGLAE